MKEPTHSSSTTIFSTLFFCVIALLIYTYASLQLTHEKKPLQRRCSELVAKKEALKAANKELLEMASSFGDPSADEFALITELGKVPEGYKKVIFVKSKKTP
jgi:hypothetical protein